VPGRHPVVPSVITNRRIEVSGAPLFWNPYRFLLNPVPIPTSAILALEARLNGVIGEVWR